MSSPHSEDITSLILDFFLFPWNQSVSSAVILPICTKAALQLWRLQFMLPYKGTVQGLWQYSCPSISLSRFSCSFIFFSSGATVLVMACCFGVLFIMLGFLLNSFVPPFNNKFIWQRINKLLYRIRTSESLWLEKIFMIIRYNHYLRLLPNHVP